MNRLTTIARQTGLIAILAGGLVGGAILGYSAAAAQPATATNVYISAVHVAPVGGVIVTAWCPEEDSLDHDAALCTILDVTPNR